jgi:hypothetical protein
MATKVRPLEWFESRIGRTVVRKTVVCDCDSCRCANKDGFLVVDRLHAKSLYDHQVECGFRYVEGK